MGGLYFLGFTIGILLIIAWCFVNDERPAGRHTTGLFAIADVAAMKKEAAARLKKEAEERAQRWRRPHQRP